MPYFWTDQYDTKITVHGLPAPTDNVSILEGSLADRRFVAEFHDGAAPTGLIGWNMPREAVRQRKRITPTYQHAIRAVHTAAA